jgi:septal ring factor EnvC (AmiA/AmiB activator)
VRRAAGAWLAIALLGGCTIAEMRADNARGEERVQGKAAELERERSALERLQTERERLLSDLRTRELGLAELRTRLRELQRINDGSDATTQDQVRRKAARARQLDEAASRVQRLEAEPAAPDRARRLDDVRRQLRGTLEQLLLT